MAAAVTPLAACSHTAAGPPQPKEIRALLARQAAAVRDGDTAAFAAGLDTSPGAADFRAAELSAFATLRQLPIANWRYADPSPSHDGAALAASARRYGAPAVLERVALRYALGGVDRRSSTHELWLTFVERDGHAVVAGDDDLASQGATSWRGPWDFGPGTVVRAPHALVLGHPGEADLLSGIAADTAGALTRASDVLGHGVTPPATVAVLVPDTPAETSADLGAMSPETTPQSPPAAAESAGRVVVEPDVWRRLSPAGRRIVLTHELTHLIVAGLTTARTPRWLVEGLAEYVANLDSSRPVAATAAELAAEVRRHGVPDTLPAAGAFHGAGAAVAYEQAWLACRLVARTAGTSGLLRLYRLAGREAGAAAVEAVLRESPAAFTARWRASLRARFGAAGPVGGAR